MEFLRWASCKADFAGSDEAEADRRRSTAAGAGRAYVLLDINYSEDPATSGKTEIQKSDQIVDIQPKMEDNDIIGMLKA